MTRSAVSGVQLSVNATVILCVTVLLGTYQLGSDLQGFAPVSGIITHYKRFIFEVSDT